MKIKSIMTREVKTVHLNDPLLRVKSFFDVYTFHHIPVVDDSDNVVGMISKADYHKALDHFTVFGVDKAEEANRKFLSAVVAKEIMTSPILRISPNDDIEEATRVFLENLYHALPVVDDGILAGIITSHDLLKYYALRESTLNIEEG